MVTAKEVRLSQKFHSLELNSQEYLRDLETNQTEEALIIEKDAIIPSILSNSRGTRD